MVATKRWPPIRLIILPVIVVSSHVSVVRVRMEISSLHVMYLSMVRMVAGVLVAHMRRRMAANVHHVLFIVSVIASLKEGSLVLGFPCTSTVLVFHGAAALVSSKEIVTPVNLKSTENYKTKNQ